MSEPYPFVSCGQHFSEEFGFRYADHQRSCLVEKQQSEIQRGRCQVFGLKGSASDYHCDTNHIGSGATIAPGVVANLHQ